MGKNSLEMNQITLQQLLPNTDQLLKSDELLNSYKTTMSMLDAMSNSRIIQDALDNMPKWEFILPQATQLLKSDELLNSYKTTMPILDILSNSTILQDALRLVQIPSSTFQLLSTIDMGEIQTFLEEREVQEEIQQEITSIQEETSVKTVMDIINGWALKIMNAPTTLKEKTPVIYLLSCIGLFVAGNLLLPFIQDIWKEKVLHVSEFTEEKPKENAKQLKQSLEKDFGMALSAVNQIRVTNRETPVFRSHQRISGTIDSIPCNKPVIIIEKKRNWSFIMYINTLGEEVNGWVFTGNLAK
ncbi:hypothetical protein COM49_29320 [Bacillus pseudomycoides]|uniref:hypothetical protein n=1 Tax=Bacillus pseudomycoides TaxID=64104 RepID=UPI000BFD9551|nr:hypothetical protein [Bacillus pseudomycoides]PGD90936.1 hypothetical protein COM49_29320 [Bacillus pseudomycoides]